MHRSVLRFSILLGLAVSSRHVDADPHIPVAVRWWGGGQVSIETYWQPVVAIDPRVGGEQVDAGLVVLTRPSNEDATTVDETKRFVTRLYDESGQVLPLNHVLDRSPNQAEPTFTRVLDSDRTGQSTHPLVLGRLGQMTPVRNSSPTEAPLVIFADLPGPQIIHVGPGTPLETLSTDQPSLQNVEVLLLTVTDKVLEDSDTLRRMISELAPQYVVPLYEATDRDVTNQLWQRFNKTLGDRFPARHIEGNTLALSSDDRSEWDAITLVRLQDRPWQPTGELADLFTAMERACRDSQEVFAPLSVEQMNFQPANGTHTPRWNAEHMMGRQLMFFSQIYAALDPTFTAIDLNPAQMPPDYKAAHPDWTGAEEARQMERVSQYVRRFAYLLDEADLDAPAPGSRWTLRRLLRQMEAHYDEHTANVKKKVELADWPGN